MTPPEGPTTTPTPPAGPVGRPARGRALTLVGILLLAAGVALVLVAVLQGGDGDQGAGPTTTTVAATGSAGVVPPGTTAPTTPAGIGVGWAPAHRGRTTLRGFGEVRATITAGDGATCEVCLLAATTPDQHQRGLMEVTDPDLGGYDGMLFEFGEDTGGAFWMRNTPMPLSIAYFDTAGRLVSTSDMTPCDDRPDCPSYPASSSYAFALEVPKGRLDALAVRGEATIRVDGRTCPRAGTSG